ncbi:MAG: tetratricopeptide repeat protein [Beijerinckiaceae bacterium]|jgi:Flp pilus assembly protein TadD|nr:tetratricopeptide repeat protein [Beijerinckiaceae bacterium]
MANRLGSRVIPAKAHRAAAGMRPIRNLLPALALALLASGCSSRLGQFTGSLRDVPNASGSVTEAASSDLTTLAQRYDARPGEKAASLAYGSALRARGQFQQAVAVLQRASITNVGDKDVAAAYGRALGDIGRFDEAMRVLAQAHTADRPNWRVLSSQGVIADQMGQHARARDFYAEALKIAPDHPSLLTNLGLSYLLSRDLVKAEEMLARAAARPDADPRVAANLAMVRSLRSKVAAAPAAATRPTAAPKAATAQR